MPPDTMCRACRMAPPSFVRAAAFGLYEGRMRSAIHALKYDHMHPVARGLGRMLAQCIAQFAPDAPTEMLVVPVPLHRAKQGERGFNQARSIAAEALRFLRKSHPQWRLTLASSALMRIKATNSQAGLTPRQRRLNVRGAFNVSDPARVAHRNVLVVDDIFTTGATARSAALALTRAGAASVWVATLARARRVSASRFISAAKAEEDQNQFVQLPGANFGETAESSHSSHGQLSFLTRG